MRALAFACLLSVLSGCTVFGGVDASPVPPVASDVPAASLPATTSADTPGDATPAPPTAGADNQASAPSCERLHGGRTCGADGKDDCCATGIQGTTRLGKYQVTAGRMRAFLEKVNGDVAGFVRGLPAAQWKPEWTTVAQLPTDRASANVALGPAGKKACGQGANTGHTFWTPPADGDSSDYDQDTLDDKALNCVPWSMLQALCAFDGGHLATVKDLRAAFTNDGTTTYPWGDDALPSWAKADPMDRMNNAFGFATQPNPATFRGKDGHPQEASFFIAPPGRFPKGNNRAGIADAAGNLLEWVGDSPRQFVWKGDFEHHAENAVALSGSVWMDKQKVLVVSTDDWRWGEGQLLGNAGTADQRDGYYAIGGRCAF
jgi:formylglycine-generating enzyme required for sulfatase activity